LFLLYATGSASARGKCKQKAPHLNAGLFVSGDIELETSGTQSAGVQPTMGTDVQRLIPPAFLGLLDNLWHYAHQVEKDYANKDGRQENHSGGRVESEDRQENASPYNCQHGSKQQERHNS